MWSLHLVLETTLHLALVAIGIIPRGELSLCLLLGELNEVYCEVSGLIDPRFLLSRLNSGSGICCQLEDFPFIEH